MTLFPVEARFATLALSLTEAERPKPLEANGAALALVRARKPIDPFFLFPPESCYPLKGCSIAALTREHGGWEQAVGLVPDDERSRVKCLVPAQGAGTRRLTKSAPHSARRSRAERQNNPASG